MARFRLRALVTRECQLSHPQAQLADVVGQTKLRWGFGIVNQKVDPKQVSPVQDVCRNHGRSPLVVLAGIECPTRQQGPIDDHIDELPGMWSARKRACRAGHDHTGASGYDSKL